MTAAARIELLEPRAQRPSYRYLLNIAVAVVQSAFNKLSNTGRAWTVGDTVLKAVSGTDEYSLGESGIGKILDVVTYDSANQEGTERQVTFHDLSELSGDFRGWDWPGGSRIAFYRKNGQETLYAKIRPIPTESRDYYLTYSTGSWAQEASLDDSPMLAAHHHMFVAQIARDALPATRWTNDAKEDSYTRDSLEKTLKRRIEGYERDFNLYVASINIPRITSRVEAFAIE